MTVAIPIVLADGRTAWRQEREDDCLRPCIATIMQVPIWAVPDPRIDERLAAGHDPDAIAREARAALDAFLAGHDLRAVWHRDVPLEGDWIGVSPGAGRFADHTVLMRGEAIVFDPAEGFPVPDGYKVAPITRISAGITLEAR
jgi:hypothetical protein